MNNKNQQQHATPQYEENSQIFVGGCPPKIDKSTNFKLQSTRFDFKRATQSIF